MFQNSFDDSTCSRKYKKPMQASVRPTIPVKKRTDLTNTVETVYRMREFNFEKSTETLQNTVNCPDVLKKSFLTLEVTENNPLTVIKNGTKYYKVGQMLVTDFNQVMYHQNKNTKINSNFNLKNVLFSVDDGTFIHPEQISDTLALAKTGTKIDIYHVPNENKDNSRKRIICHQQLNESITKKMKTNSNMADSERNCLTERNAFVSNKIETVTNTTILTKDAAGVTNNKIQQNTVKTAEFPYKRVISYQNTQNECISEYLSFPKETITKGKNQDKLDRSPTYSISFIPHNKASLR
ncbi:uncharacterized protein LOC108741224 [Agrilus planipennis]|uniref:Uncharacterized protein LOC108741224 n=1 Tax=Agrilus planipennis TaxID=224129 RepID=A0A1W4XGF9_AGRPL|nr:uncharacterized protein LOC108741224 [Agrilus planipennis]